MNKKLTTGLVALMLLIAPMTTQAQVLEDDFFVTKTGMELNIEEVAQQLKVPDEIFDAICRTLNFKNANFYISQEDLYAQRVNGGYLVKTNRTDEQIQELMAKMDYNTGTRKIDIVMKNGTGGVLDFHKIDNTQYALEITSNDGKVCEVQDIEVEFFVPFNHGMAFMGLTRSASQFTDDIYYHIDRGIFDYERITNENSDPEVIQEFKNKARIFASEQGYLNERIFFDEVYIK